jgi:hypothetical protein
MTREEMRERLKAEIRISARVHSLKELAADTARAYDEAEALAKAREILDRHADSDLPPRHRELRRMLFRMLPQPKKE